jgi:tetratricopeptide (TPR) repeat protein
MVSLFQPVINQHDSSANRTTAIAFVSVIILTFLVFLPDLQNGFLSTWDDGEYIVYNDKIGKFSFEMFRWAFSESYTGNWIPLTWVSLALDRALWGLNPMGYHLTNNAIHAVNSGIFFLVSLKLLTIYDNTTSHHTTKTRFLATNNIIYSSLLAALLFGIHPLRVESVAWVAERKDVLCLFFGLPAVLLYLNYTQVLSHDGTPGSATPPLPFLTSRAYWISLVVFCLSLLSKPMLVSLPLVLLVLDWFPLRRISKATWKDVVLDKLAYMFISGVVLALAVYTQSATFIPNQVANLSSRLLIACKATMFYLLYTFYPLNLSPFYLHPGNISEMSPAYSVSLAFFAALTGCSILVRKRYPAVTAAWLIYLVTLIPVLGLAPIGLVEMADRYTYIPCLSVSLLTALGIRVLYTRYAQSRTAIVIISGLTVLILAGIAYLTTRQISYWHDDVSLWSRPIDVKPHFSGKVYFQRGRSYAARGDYQKALEDLNEAHTIAQRKNVREMQYIYLERARVLRQLGDARGAIVDYTLAIESDPSPARYMYYLERGELYKALGREDLAQEDFNAARNSMK